MKLLPKLINPPKILSGSLKLRDVGDVEVFLIITS